VFSDAGKFIVFAGVVTVVIGLFIMASGKAGVSGWFNWFGTLPLDIRIERGNFRFFFPLGSSLLLTLLLNMILYFFNKIIR
jgi:hypothetical protein